MSKLDYTELLANKDRPTRVIYISSYIPRKCGIATFTKDLTTAINNLNPTALAEIAAVTDPDQSYDYPWEVKTHIDQLTAEDYLTVANYINQSSADVVNLQHEFGLYGGTGGDYILPMIDTIEKPIVTCFHSILPNPDPHQLYIMKRIIDKSAVVVAMSELSRKVLIDIYECEPSKAVVIFHGVPDFTFEKPDAAKRRLGYGENKILLMTGLLGPGKGTEYVIDAMPKIIKDYPETKFVVVGQTHPNLIKEQGEQYRDSLIARAKKLKVLKNVEFVNKYVSLDELMEYYRAADIYLTPHLDPQQPTSGTLAYALGAGKVCISTPYNYAKQVLKDNVGIMVDFKNGEEIADATVSVFGDSEKFQGYRSRAYGIGKRMQWPRVAQNYLTLFRSVSEHSRANQD